MLGHVGAQVGIHDAITNHFLKKLKPIGKVMPGSTAALADSSNIATNEEILKVQIIGRESYTAVAFMSGLNKK